MTPLEKAKQNQAEQPCFCCEKSERIDGILYCGVNGKLYCRNLKAYLVAEENTKERENNV